MPISLTTMKGLPRCLLIGPNNVDEHAQQVVCAL